MTGFDENGKNPKNPKNPEKEIQRTQQPRRGWPLRYGKICAGARRRSAGAGAQAEGGGTRAGRQARAPATRIPDLERLAGTDFRLICPAISGNPPGRFGFAGGYNRVRRSARTFNSGRWQRFSHGPSGASMDRIRIVGGQRLNGAIPISGAKNATLPLDDRQPADRRTR